MRIGNRRVTTDPGGQVGCTHTSQGFEFDNTGVIFDPDLRYDGDPGHRVGHPKSG